nr:hypothetical protein [uncultured Dyadobacter sp.]
MYNVSIIPVPSKISVQNGKNIGEINLVVSIRHGSDPTQKISLIDFDKDKGFDEFPAWITGLMKNISITVNSESSDSHSALLVSEAKISNPPEGLKSMWLQLKAPLNDPEIIQRLSIDLTRQTRFDLTKIDNVIQKTSEDISKIAERIKENQSKKLSYEQQDKKLRSRQTVWTSIIDDFKRRNITLEEEFDSYIKNLDSSQQRILNRIKEAKSLPDKLERIQKGEVDSLNEIGKSIRKLSTDIKSDEYSILEKKRFLSVLSKIATTKGIIESAQLDTQVVNEEMSKKRDGQTSSSSVNENAAYTSNFNQPEVVHLSDIIGYFSNYDSLRRGLGLLWTLKFPLNSDDSSAQKLLHSGEVGIKFEGHQELARISSTFTLENNYSVAYEISQAKDDTVPFHFRPASKPTGSKSFFKDGFLNLKATDTYRNKPYNVFEILQNLPQQIYHNKSGFADHTTGLFVVRNRPSDAIIESLNPPSSILYLENLVVGYRFDVSEDSSVWKSLHEYTGTVSFASKNYNIDQEGWTARESIVEVKPRVYVVNGDVSDEEAVKLIPQALDTSTTPIGKYRIVELVGNDPTKFSLTNYAVYMQDNLNDVGENPLAAEIKLLTTNGLSDEEKEAAVTKNNDLLDVWLIGDKISLSNFDGEVYYNVLQLGAKTPENTFSASQFLPTSTLCNITGGSLSVGITISSRLANEVRQLNSRNSTIRNNIENGISLAGYLAKCRLLVNELKPRAKSLPLLRIDSTYSIRARLVSIDGTSHQLSAKTSIFLKKKYLRQESICPPDMYLTTAIHSIPTFAAKVNTTNQIVVYSEYESQLKSQTRVLASSVISWKLSEWSSVFDTEKKLDPEKLFDFSQRLMPDIEKISDGTYYWAGKTGKYPELLQDASKPLPYLSDPLSRQLFICASARNRKSIFNDLPFEAVSIIKNITPFDPLNVYPITLKVIADENEGVVSIQEKDRTIEIRLGPGEDVEFILQSYPWWQDTNMNSDFDHYYKPDSLVHNKAKGELNIPDLVGIATFRAVHPVRKLKKFAEYKIIQGKPAIERLRKKPGDSELLKRFRTRLNYPGKTVDNLELYAEWTDILDEAQKDGIQSNFIPIRLVTSTGIVKEFSDSPEQKKRIIERMLPTKTYEGLARYISEEERIVHDDINELQVEFEHTLPDTKHRVCRYWFEVNNRFQSLLNSGEVLHKRTLVEQPNIESRTSYNEVVINSSKNPDAPKFAFALPVYTWEFKGGATLNSATKRVRNNNIIRIYLERPWYSSGQNEQLAIICGPDRIPTDSWKMHDQNVSSWGRDATVSGKKLSPLSLNMIVNKGDVPQEAFSLLNKKLEVISPKIFQIGIFDVKFDSTECLWFVDVQLDVPTSYSAFVRFSIARYQASSEPGKHLSQFILTDFIQLQGPRSLSVDDLGQRRSIYLNVSEFGKASFTRLATVTFFGADVDNSVSSLFAKSGGEEQSMKKNGDDGFIWTDSIENLNRFSIALVREYEVYEGDTNEERRRLVHADILHIR